MPVIEGTLTELERNYVMRILFWLMVDIRHDLRGKRYRQEKQAIMDEGRTSEQIEKYVERAMSTRQYTEFTLSLLNRR